METSANLKSQVTRTGKVTLLDFTPFWIPIVDTRPKQRYITGIYTSYIYGTNIHSKITISVWFLTAWLLYHT